MRERKNNGYFPSTKLPPRISFRYLYVQQRIYHNFIPTPKTQNYFCFSQTPFTIGSEFLPRSLFPLHRYNGGGPPGAPPSFSQVKAAREFAATEGGHLGPSPPFSLSKAAREFTEFTEDLSVSFSSVHKSRGPNGTSPATPPAINKINAPPLRSGFIPLKENYRHSTRPKVVHTDQDGYFIKRENIGPNGEIQDPITSQNWDSISNVAQGQLKYYTNQCRGVTHENLSSAEWIRVGVKIEIELQDTPEKDLPKPGDWERFKNSKDQKNKKYPGNSPINDTYGPESIMLEENYPLLSEQEMSVKEKISGWEDATIHSVTCKGSEKWGKQPIKKETSSEQRVMPLPLSSQQSRPHSALERRLLGLALHPPGPLAPPPTFASAATTPPFNPSNRGREPPTPLSPLPKILRNVQVPNIIQHTENIGVRDHISEGDSDRSACHNGWWKCEHCKGWWRTTGRVGWEESREEFWNNTETGRNAEICDMCAGQLWEPEGRHTQELRSPTGNYSEGGERWVYVGMTQTPPPETLNFSQKTFRIGMIRGTRGEDDRDGDEDILMYTPSPPRIRGPRSKPENGEENTEEDTENEEDPPPEYHTPDEDHISPARRRKPAGYSPGGTLVPYQPPPEVQLAIDEIKKGRLDLDKYFSRTTIFGETGQPFTFKSSDFDSFKTPPYDFNDPSSPWVV